MSGCNGKTDHYSRLRQEFDLVSRFLDEAKPKCLHSLGITGIGLSGLSLLFKKLGWVVSGCDSSPSAESVSWLESVGIPVSTGHSASHIESFKPDLIIRSPAVGSECDELVAAEKLGIPCVCRGAALAAIASRRNTIAVCGAHGKTTTSCFTASLLKKAGFAPSWCIGGYTAEMGGVASDDDPSAPLVIEADESDGTLALYHPSVLVFNSADIDHLEHFEGVDDLYGCYGQVIANTRVGLAYCGDNDSVCKIVEKYKPSRTDFKAISFGFSESCTVRAVNPVLHAAESEFELVIDGISYGRVILPVPGSHNVLNALGALSGAVISLELRAKSLEPRTQTCGSECGMACRPATAADEFANEHDFPNIPRKVKNNPSAAESAAPRSRPPCHEASSSDFEPEEELQNRQGYCSIRILSSKLQALSFLPKRRFEEEFLSCGITAISDYSHHPAEISALVKTARLRSPKRLVAVFQPHRYSRTKALAEDFPSAFSGIDAMALLPVYAASEKPLPGGRSEDLYAEFRRQAESDSSIPVPYLIDSLKSALLWLRRFLRDGDMLLVVGAGSIVKIFETLPAAFIEKTAEEILATAIGHDSRLDIGKSTSYGIGGSADIAFKVAGDGELKQMLRFAKECSLPVHVLGGGTNLLVADTGVRGVTLALDGDDYSTIAIDKNSGTVLAGANVAGAYLLNKLREEGLSGLEYMSGIPGTVGGWLAMNAGTPSGCFGDRVVSFTAYDYDGNPYEINAEDAGFAYRQCTALADKIVTSVKLRLEPDFPNLIKGRMDAAREKRFNFAGLRTAGSVFRNPPGTSAGKLLDQAGCKGMRVGGAKVCERHANIIHVESGAMASDVIALSQIMHDKVLEQFGIDLQREIRIWN